MRVLKVFAIIFIIIGWLRLDWLIGMHSLKRKRRSSVYPWRKGEINFFDDGVAWMKSLELDIMEAKRSICLLFYIIEPDEVGRRLFSLLEGRVKDGVEVRILCDALGSKNMKKWIKPLKEAGIHIAFSRPLIFKGSFFSLQRRNHRKIVIIDGELAHVGGFNIGREYVNLDPVLSPWRDYHLRITGSGVEDLLSEFQIDWQREFKKTQHHVEAVSHKAKSSSSYQIVPSEPVNMEAFMLDLFDLAEKSIFIGTPYFIPTEKLFSCLKNKLADNIAVTILVPGTPDHALVQPASFHFLRELINLGAHVYQFEHGFYHAKVLLIDEKLCDVGTTNFDRRSILINDELNVLTTDKKILLQVQQSIQKDLQHSVRVSKDMLKPQGIGGTAMELVARSFSHLL
ncbi:phospholipase D-like domain-containing protein [Jeotgalibacillus sp. ET6]|uniref:phospholipase D-like domain-containing protein n=1 Tax=Jeotgalibacillus sp. ET6 TaxID=3037260 RepID=UPI0024187E4E|nr:phospholipase D-like domain-containing protein [Jeotgalibacillus sp. ET6]MDG5471144.1 phospholipase D-like domain-containing protein [Jeotgalibacillus sp. ET6]